MAKPFNAILQPGYTKAAACVRAMDEVDGGAEPPLECLTTAIFALEAGLITAKISDGNNSAYDSLVMLHELRERLLSIV